MQHHLLIADIKRVSRSLALALALGLGRVVSLGALPIVVLCAAAREQFTMTKRQFLSACMREDTLTRRGHQGSQRFACPWAWASGAGSIAHNSSVRCCARTVHCNQESVPASL